jgi:glutamine transport system substrate-binding protein
MSKHYIKNSLLIVSLLSAPYHRENLPNLGLIVFKKVWKTIGVLLVCGLTACWPKKEEKTEQSTKKAVTEKATLHIASDFNYQPFVYKEPKETDPANPNANKKGLEIDILMELAKRLDFHIVFEELKFEEIIDAVASGRVDGAIGGISVTANRKEKVLFTVPFYKSPIVSIVTVDNTATPMDDTQEFDMFVISDPDFTDFVGQQLSERYKKLKVANFPLWEDVLQSFETNKGGIYITDRLHAEHLMQNTPNLRIVSEFTDQTGLSTGGGLPIAFAFNQKHDGLVLRINTEIQKMEEDGTLKQIMEKVAKTPIVTMPAVEVAEKEKPQDASIEKILDTMANENIEPAIETVIAG